MENIMLHPDSAKTSSRIQNNIVNTPKPIKAIPKYPYREPTRNRSTATHDTHSRTTPNHGSRGHKIPNHPIQSANREDNQNKGRWMMRIQNVIFISLNV
jgi:hypothetical protein